MTYEEALGQLAKERDCAAGDLSVCSESGVSECGIEPCVRVRELMAQRATPAIALTKVEIQSNYNRAEWAEGLIRQLPETHQGRNSWLLNYGTTAPEKQGSNPKTLMGNMKVRNLSVIPFTALIHEARAMEYGAFNAPRKDGSKGYGPFNWRDQNIEYLVYAEAAIRHIASAVDREDIDPDTGDLKVLHLALARATLGILIDAIEHRTVIDDRSPTACGRVAALLRELRKPS